MVKDCPDCFHEVLSEEAVCECCGHDLIKTTPRIEDEDWEPFN